MGRLIDREELVALRETWRERGEDVVFTNGCFDLIHAGHLALLRTARSFGSHLIVGINEDDSVTRLKGEGRPLLSFGDRAELLGALAPVDFVIGFSSDTPLDLIEALFPDVLVKGGDYSVDTVVGAEAVHRDGGRVEIVPLVTGRSTSDLIARIVRHYGHAE